MEVGIISSVFIPLVLAIMMVGMGTTLTVDDFRRLRTHPKSALVGFLSQVLLLPVLAFLIVSVAGLSPELSLGVMIISLCPGGAGSNLMSLIVRSDTALSVSLTALSNVILVFTLPLLINFFIVYFGKDVGGLGDISELPVLNTIATTACITVIPIIIGMLLRHFAHAFTQKIEPKFRVFSTVFLAILMLGIAIQNKDIIVSTFIRLGPAIFALNFGAIALGYMAAKMAGLTRPEKITIAIETGFQNAALAILITTSFLHNTTVALAPAFYGGVMFIGAFVLISLVRLSTPKT